MLLGAQASRLLNGAASRQTDETSAPPGPLGAQASRLLNGTASRQADGTSAA